MRTAYLILIGLLTGWNLCGWLNEKPKPEPTPAIEQENGTNDYRFETDLTRVLYHLDDLTYEKSHQSGFWEVANKDVTIRSNKAGELEVETKLPVRVNGRLVATNWIRQGAWEYDPDVFAVWRKK